MNCQNHPDTEVVIISMSTDAPYIDIHVTCPECGESWARVRPDDFIPISRKKPPEHYEKARHLKRLGLIKDTIRPINWIAPDTPPHVRDQERIMSMEPLAYLRTFFPGYAIAESRPYDSWSEKRISKGNADFMLTLDALLAHKSITKEQYDAKMSEFMRTVRPADPPE